MVKIWDLPTRIFHWVLVALFTFLIYSGRWDDSLMQWHFYSGYALSGLILFRVLWGIFGTHYARFCSFITSPIQGISYLKATFTGKAKHFYGHNPAGAMMVIMLILLLMLQVASGLITSDEILWEGPFYASVSDELASLGAETHHLVQSILVYLVGFHILGVILHSILFKEKLVSAMVTGKKKDLGNATPRGAINPIALTLCIAISAGWVYYLFSLPV
ncbi:branched-chain alpha-keto acid dehydrogenase subunit E2 [Amphritea opalescens]|uniref:Branched-chain alpha-keto acid dehydrogenase subunit E2 n=1 Tax=Amphritea opalescens TaxID=2490544 RepID=A0A430KS85_9GAMM|nr:cytochrome b/b6 domain-containing protein [Amphritea opalescens]RTE66330.1 branched-chain alpha-keto acid dehydrogenase subunit E2 [Amphritea opalescens]